MVTLTCADQSHERAKVVRRVGRFVRRLKVLYGAQPYVFALERHKSGAWHAHLALRGRRPHGTVKALWGRGHVWLSEPPRPEVYLAKYIGKDLGGAPAGAHRYEVGQNFPPTLDRLEVWGEVDAWRAAVAYMGGELPAYEWASSSDAEWRGPPTVFLSWDLTPTVKARPSGTPGRRRSRSALTGHPY